MNKTISIIVIVSVVVIGGYFLFRGGYQAPQEETQTQLAPTETFIPTQEPETTAPQAPSEEETQQPANEEGGASSLPIKEVTVSGTEFSFSPSAISVQPGQTVRVIFQNTGSIVHNFALQGIGSTRTISAGQSDTLEFTAPESPGSYPVSYECTVPGHSERGMVGSLTVE